MNDATQKLVDEARAMSRDGEVGTPAERSVIIGRLAAALETERGHMQSLAKWVGVDEATSSLEIACEVSAALEAAQRPPVSPEVAEALPVVAHKGPHDTDESMFLTAADNLDRGYIRSGAATSPAPWSS